MAERPLNDRRSIVGRLYDQHGASLYRYALMLLADPAAAADAVQQVFAALLRPAATIAFDNEAHYLRQAVRNECFSTLSRRRVRDEHATESLLEPASLDPVAPEERIALERAIRALPVDQREVVHLHVFEGLTFREIAEEAGESINTVAGRYRYALAKLRSELG
ncbi:MAG: sigma-70 family RNA polymerase sigma factor [Acidobacteriota bacterium]|nr:sigma-70 family RNA polymerase sigma factor [Acidobacteriota bacterium]